MHCLSLQEYDEPLYSWFLNVVMIAAVTTVVMNRVAIVTTAAAALLTWAVLRRKMAKVVT